MSLINYQPNPAEPVYLGKVMPFAEKAEKGMYRFLNSEKFGEVFFHKSMAVTGLDFKTFEVGVEVLFQIKKEFEGREGNKIVAFNVIPLTQIVDGNLLYNLYESNITQNLNRTSVTEIALENRLAQLLGSNVDQQLSESLFLRFSAFSMDQFNEINPDIRETQDPTKYLVNKAKRFIINCEKLFPIFKEKRELLLVEHLSAEVSIALWKDASLQLCPVNQIVDEILANKQFNISENLSRIQSENIVNIFFGVLLKVSQYADVERYEYIKLVLNWAEKYIPNYLNSVQKEALNACNVEQKIDLWLNGLHEELDFELFKPHIIWLKPERQKKFLKKVFYYIASEKVQLTVEDVTSINVIDFQTREYAEEIDGSFLDYSTSIVLNVIKELHEQRSLESWKDKKGAQNRMLELIISQIKEPKHLLEISGYFDKCEGRGVFNRVGTFEHYENVEHRYQANRNKYDIPRGHIYCDGRVAISNDTSVYSKNDLDPGLKLWWCANRVCADACRKDHEQTEWENYTIHDFLRILNIPYNEEDYALYLGLINKLNRFISHLKCSKCSKMLRPIRQSNYAVSGANEFHCINEDCEEKHKHIYIIHCLNGRCINVIDSRVSVKCKHKGHDDMSGMYVCTDCHACCSTSVYKRREEVAMINNVPYRGVTIGHRDQGIVCCSDCGNEMNSSKGDSSNYKEILGWLKNNCTTADNIVSYGTNKKGKMWFRIQELTKNKDEFYKVLEYYAKIGFQIPNFHEYERDIQLISESNDENDIEVLICSNSECKKVLAINSMDADMAISLKRFHSVRFPKYQIKIKEQEADNDN